MTVVRVGTLQPRKHEKMRGNFETQPVRNRTMEAERINLIGNRLADLSARTLDLRGYL